MIPAHCCYLTPDWMRQTSITHNSKIAPGDKDGCEGGRKIQYVTSISERQTCVKIKVKIYQLLNLVSSFIFDFVNGSRAGIKF